MHIGEHMQQGEKINLVDELIHLDDQVCLMK